VKNKEQDQIRSAGETASDKKFNYGFTAVAKIINFRIMFKKILTEL